MNLEGLGRLTYCKEVYNMPFNDINVLINSLTMVTWEKKVAMNEIKYYSVEGIILKNTYIREVLSRYINLNLGKFFSIFLSGLLVHI